MADRDTILARDLAYGHETHRAFNERLAAPPPQQNSAPSVTGPWLSNEALAGLPQTKRAFDLSRDPLVRAQIRDQAQRDPGQQGESGGRGSAMVGQDKAKPNFRPGKDISLPVDRAAFRANWLAEQRDAALAQAKPRQDRRGETPAPLRQPREPSR